MELYIFNLNLSSKLTRYKRVLKESPIHLPAKTKTKKTICLCTEILTRSLVKRFKRLVNIYNVSHLNFRNFEENKEGFHGIRY